MKGLNSLRVAVLLLSALLFQISAQAHTGLQKTTPEADSTIATPPQTIQLVFSGPVRLLKFELLGVGHTMPTEFKANPEPATEFNITTPGMHPGAFTVNWAAMGADGHTLTDTFAFTVAAPTASDAE